LWSNGYFFFFFAVFFAFFAFLAMFPSVTPKLNASRHKSKLHQIPKIDTARFKEGKRRHDTRPCEGFARCVDTARLVRSRREEEVLTRSEDEADGSEAKQWPRLNRVAGKASVRKTLLPTTSRV
jgi:hypothetical protein